MKRNCSILLVAIASIVATSCSSGNDYWDDFSTIVPQDNMSSGSTTAGGATTAGDLTSFEIAVDSTSLSESETVPADDEDYLENNTFGTTLYINYNGSSASVSGSADGVSISVSGADVVVTSTTAGVNYVLSGSTTDGMFKMSGESTKKFQLTLNGVTIKNADGPAINIQCGKRCYVTLAEGTLNTLTDGTSYASSTEDQKGTIFSEGKILFNGTGSLRVYSNTKNGICSDDYVMFRPGNNIYVKSTSNHCVKTNDAIIIKGGVINCETSATAAKGFKTDGYFQQDGGRAIAITTGAGEYDSDDKDVSGAAGVKADSIIVINGGELFCKSTGKGGKGISTDQTMTVNDGTVKVITTGTTYSYSNTLDSKAKGIKADGDLTVNGGAIQVRATGDSGSEGIESKGIITINSGSVESYSYDDAINSGSHFYIKGGYVYGFGINNDGLDANGNLCIQGGTTVAYGTSSPECGLDANEEGGYSLIITGGTVVGVGGGTSYPSSKSTQPSIVFGGSLSTGSTLALQSGSTNVLALNMGRSYNGTACFLLSAPSLTKGSAYTLYTGATASGTDWHGLITGATISSTGTSAATVSSLSSPYSSCGSSTGGMGGGMQPGGRR